jgi:hypothetical protein
VDGPNFCITFNGKTVEVERVAIETQRIADLFPGDLNSTPLLALLRRLAPFLKELRLDAPTRRRRAGRHRSRADQRARLATALADS